MYASGVGDFLRRYVTIVPILVTVYNAVFGLGGASCPIRCGMVFRGSGPNSALNTVVLQPTPPYLSLYSFIGGGLGAP